MEKAQPSGRRLQRFYIEELCGPGTPPIDIPFNLEKRVTVLHGRNGSGKTITLQLLHALFQGRYEALLEYPFKKAELTLDDGARLTIERASPSTEVANQWNVRHALRIEVQLPGENPSEYHWAGLRAAEMADFIEVSVPGSIVKRVGNGEWIESQRMRFLSTEDVIRRHLKPPTQERLEEILAFGRESAAALAFRERLPNVRFIPVERLGLQADDLYDIYDALSRNRLQVLRLSEDIRDLVYEADRAYRNLSTALDRDLASRLLRKPVDEELPPLEALRQRYEVLEHQESKLRSLGLFREMSRAVDEADLKDENRHILHTVLSDREAKLQPFEPVVSKAQRLLASINAKLKPKTIKLSVDKGYEVLTASQEPLPLEKLSSGEQHELILLHKLLFDTPAGSLILIDEPELSLHVTWQEELLPDILEIARLASLDLVLATHSPYIVGEHFDLMVRLGESL